VPHDHCRGKKTERKTDLVFPLSPDADTDTPSSTMPLGLNLFDLNELSSALQSHHDEMVSMCGRWARKRLRR